MDDEITLSGQGVLASYDQSTGDLTDTKRVGISASKRQIMPVDLATNRLMSNKALPELLPELGARTIEREERNSYRSTMIFVRGNH